MALSCAVTAFWFTLIKTTPFANEATEAFASWLVGGPTRIVLDLTDLIALPMIGLAWGLWIQLKPTALPFRPGVTAYIALSIAGIATIATGGCARPPRVVKLAVHNDIVYARLDISLSAQPLNYVQSSNGGRTWDSVASDSLPKDIAAILENQALTPLIICGSDNPKTCYRIAGREQIEKSTDGGQTWQVAWRIPLGRRKHMERYVAFGPSALCKSPEMIDIGPYDLAFANYNGKKTLLAALGNEGVLLVEPDGTWNRYAVMQAQPTPFVTKDVASTAIKILPELTVAGLIAATALFMSYFRASRDSEKKQDTKPPTIGRAIPSYRSIIAIFLISALLAVAFATSKEFRIGWDATLYRLATFMAIPLILGGWLSVISVPVLALVFIMQWRNLAKKSARPRFIWMACGISSLMAIGIILLTAIPFSLWLFGIIPMYEMALAIAALAILFTLHLGFHNISFYVRLAED